MRIVYHVSTLANFIKHQETIKRSFNFLIAVSAPRKPRIFFANNTLPIVLYIFPISFEETVVIQESIFPSVLLIIDL